MPSSPRKAKTVDDDNEVSPFQPSPQKKTPVKVIEEDNNDEVTSFSPPSTANSTPAKKGARPVDSEEDTDDDEYVERPIRKANQKY